MLQNFKSKCKICQFTKLTFAYVHAYVLVMYFYA
jgi:hypothetical protein